ncbi:MAG TPA: hypothetical protein VKJ45_28595, partial [Blastocatellia bacterium]|nr:hypothetical protein [Blastocatellia bacterium]
LARVIVQNARFPQPEVVMAMDAQAINFFNTFAPNLVDLALGIGVPFLDGLRRSALGTKNGSGNLYKPSEPKLTKDTERHELNESRSKASA